MSRVRIAVLSTQQQMVNLIAIDAARASRGARWSDLDVDVLETDFAARAPWSDNLVRLLMRRGANAGRIRLRAIHVEDEFDPFAISDRLCAHYRDVPSVAWAYSGAQKAQSVGMFAAFTERRAGDPPRADEAICVELQQSTCHRHDGMTSSASPVDVDFDVQEHLVLSGHVVATPGRDLRAAPPTSPAGATPADALRFQTDLAYRSSVVNYPHAFEHAVACRMARFLAQAQHRVFDARWGTVRGPENVEHDFLLASRAGRLIGLDAKSGSSSSSTRDKFRFQWRAVEEVGGTGCPFFNVVPWFPRYLDHRNADFDWDPSTPANPPDRFQGLWQLWQSVDENFARGWRDRRPPDDPTTAGFHDSRIVPFDAGDLFEQRLARILA